MHRVQTIEHIETALTVLNAQRGVFGNEIVDAMMAPLQQQLLALRQPEPAPTGERKLVTIMFAIEDVAKRLFVRSSNEPG